MTDDKLAKMRNGIRIIKDDDFIPDLEKNVHYISWTPYDPVSGSYSRSAYTDKIVRSKPFGGDPEGLYRDIDRNSDVGTLYPQHRITLMSYRLSLGSSFYYVMRAHRLFHARAAIFDLRDHAYTNTDSAEPDNEAFLQDLVREIGKQKYLSDPFSVYVIMPSYQGMLFEIASAEEVSRLRERN